MHGNAGAAAQVFRNYLRRCSDMCDKGVSTCIPAVSVALCVSDGRLSEMKYLIYVNYERAWQKCCTRPRILIKRNVCRFSKHCQIQLKLRKQLHKSYNAV